MDKSTTKESHETGKELSWEELQRTVKQGTCVDMTAWKNKLIKALASYGRSNAVSGNPTSKSVHNTTEIRRTLAFLGMSEVEIRDGIIAARKNKNIC